MGLLTNVMMNDDGVQINTQFVQKVCSQMQVKQHTFIITLKYTYHL